MKMYVIVREDLAFKYVQGSHALAEFALVHPRQFQLWNNRTVIFLSVFNGIALRDTLKRLKQNRGRTAHYAAFYEPDLRSKLPTAICLFDPDESVKSFTDTLNLATK